MIKVSHLQTFNWDGAMRGMRNPMNSHNKSDTFFRDGMPLVLGKSDKALMLKLVKAGSSHRKWLRQVFICCDITAPDLFFKEYSTYKVGTVENSTSTMHKLGSRELVPNDFSFDHNTEGYDLVIGHINKLIREYQESKDLGVWRKIIEILPMSYNYTRTCTFNYEVMLNMYNQRNTHKLDEWKWFCDCMLENLYLFKEIVDAQRV